MSGEDALRAEALSISIHKPIGNKMYAAHESDAIRKDRKKRRRSVAKVVVKYSPGYIRCCYRCHMDKLSSEYNKSSSNPHGIRKYCRSCEHEKYEEKKQSKLI